jgi:hypothetical protein
MAAKVPTPATGRNPALVVCPSATMQTLAELCADPDYDLYKGEYRVEHRLPRHIADLKQQELTDASFDAAVSVPMYFVMCTYPQALVQVVHHPFTVQAPIGRQPDLDGRRFMLTGDVIGGQLPAVIEYPLDLVVPLYCPPDDDRSLSGSQRLFTPISMSIRKRSDLHRTFLAGYHALYVCDTVSLSPPG